jgi:hypothetical protein
MPSIYKYSQVFKLTVSSATASLQLKASPFMAGMVLIALQILVFGGALWLLVVRGR